MIRLLLRSYSFPIRVNVSKIIRINSFRRQYWSAIFVPSQLPNQSSFSTYLEIYLHIILHPLKKIAVPEIYWLLNTFKILVNLAILEY